MPLLQKLKDSGLSHNEAVFAMLFVDGRVIEGVSRNPSISVIHQLTMLSGNGVVWFGIVMCTDPELRDWAHGVARRVYEHFQQGKYRATDEYEALLEIPDELKQTAAAKMVQRELEVSR